MKALIVQLVIVGGVIVFYKTYLPRMQKAQLAEAARAREQKMEAFAGRAIVADPTRDASGIGADGERLLHAQKLQGGLSLDEVQQALGAPNQEFSDYNQGQHLIWTGTVHKLEAVFTQGRLVILHFENLQSGHGVLVYESSAYWRSF